MNRPVVIEVSLASMVQLFGPAGVAVAEVMQADGDLNQPLIEPPAGALVILPEIFPLASFFLLYHNRTFLIHP